MRMDSTYAPSWSVHQEGPCRNRVWVQLCLPTGDFLINFVLLWLQVESLAYSQAVGAIGTERLVGLPAVSSSRGESVGN